MGVFPITSIVVCLAVGVLAGWLEKRRQGVTTPLSHNVAIATLGSLLSGWFFSTWGELASTPWQLLDLMVAPTVSGLVGATVSLTVSEIVLSLWAKLRSTL